MFADARTPVIIFDVVLNPDTIKNCNNDKDMRNMIAQFAIANVTQKSQLQLEESKFPFCISIFLPNVKRFFFVCLEFKFPNLRYKGTAADGGGPPPQRIKQQQRAKVEEVDHPGTGHPLKDVMSGGSVSTSKLASHPSPSSSSPPPSSVQTSSSSSRASSSSFSRSPSPPSTAPLDLASSQAPSPASLRAKAILEQTSSLRGANEFSSSSPSSEKVSRSLPEYDVFYRTATNLVHSKDYSQNSPPSSLEIVIRLPGVSSSSELDVEASSVDLCIKSLPEAGTLHDYFLRIPLPYQSDDGNAGPHDFLRSYRSLDLKFLQQL